jgi:predicted 3-demethylubiquinone-9 3-methyltransferase (glyoxalase superfamily)
MATLSKITPCLWFDTQAEEAARFYVSLFENSAIDAVSHYGKAGYEIHGRPAGSVMTVVFRLAGQTFTALNGGPLFKFTEAVSLQIFCDSQAEIDRYWSKLTAGGSESQCGWLKDKFGLSWQVVPADITKLMIDPVRSDRVMAAVMKMKKLDLAEMRRAYEGK